LCWQFGSGIHFSFSLCAIRPDEGCKIEEVNVPVMILGERANIKLVLFEWIVGKMMVEQDSGDDFTNALHHLTQQSTVHCTIAGDVCQGTL
jgi:hypothetical protein